MMRFDRMTLGKQQNEGTKNEEKNQFFHLYFR